MDLAQIQFVVDVLRTGFVYKDRWFWCLIVRIVVVGCSRVNGENISPVIRSFLCCSLSSWTVVVEGVDWLSGLLFAVVVHSVFSVWSSWVVMLLTLFAIVTKDRQQLAQRSCGTSCVGFYVQRNCQI